VYLVKESSIPAYCCSEATANLVHGMATWTVYLKHSTTGCTPSFLDVWLLFIFRSSCSLLVG